MTTPSDDAHVRLDIHPTHTSAVTATITGPGQGLVHAVLTVRGFEALGEDTLVMARIDHEEPYWAENAAQALTAEGFATEITPPAPRSDRRGMDLGQLPDAVVHPRGDPGGLKRSP